MGEAILSPSNFNIEPQNPLAVVGSFGYLEIALNCGNAKNYLKAQTEDMIREALKY